MLYQSGPAYAHRGGYRNASDVQSGGEAGDVRHTASRQAPDWLLSRTCTRAPAQHAVTRQADSANRNAITSRIPQIDRRRQALG